MTFIEKLYFDLGSRHIWENIRYRFRVIAGGEVIVGVSIE